MSLQTINDKTDDATDNRIDEPQPLSGLTGFQRDVLFVVASFDGTNPNGVTIKRKLREVCDEEINHGRLYQNLRELVDEDLIDKRPIDGRTNAYRLSEPAHKHLAVHSDWMSECLANETDTHNASGQQ